MTQFVASMIASAVSIYTLLILAAVLFTWSARDLASSVRFGTPSCR